MGKVLEGTGFHRLSALFTNLSDGNLWCDFKISLNSLKYIDILTLGDCISSDFSDDHFC